MFGSGRVQGPVEGFIFSCTGEDGRMLYLNGSFWWHDYEGKDPFVHSGEAVEKILAEGASWKILPEFIQAAIWSPEEGLKITGEKKAIIFSQSSVKKNYLNLVDGFIVSCMGERGYPLYLNRAFSWHDYEGAAPFVHAPESVQKIQAEACDWKIKPQFMQSAVWNSEEGVKITGDIKKFPLLSVACDFEPKP